MKLKTRNKTFYKLTWGWSENIFPECEPCITYDDAMGFFGRQGWCVEFFDNDITYGGYVPEMDCGCCSVNEDDPCMFEVSFTEVEPPARIYLVTIEDGEEVYEELEAITDTYMLGRELEEHVRDLGWYHLDPVRWGDGYRRLSTVYANGCGEDLEW